MAKADSNNRRSIVNQYEQGIEVIIPNRKSQLVNFVLLLWLAGWAYAEVTILRNLLDMGDTSPDAFQVFWLIGWTLSGMFVFTMWLWNDKGREIIRINATELKLSREYVYFSRSRIYQTSLVSNLRVNPQTVSNLEMGGGKEFWGLTGGTIAFDYNRRIHKMGLGLEEAEAIEIIEALLSRFEDLRTKYKH